MSTVPRASALLAALVGLCLASALDTNALGYQSKTGGRDVATQDEGSHGGINRASAIETEPNEFTIEQAQRRQQEKPAKTKKKKVKKKIAKKKSLENDDKAGPLATEGLTPYNDVGEEKKDLPKIEDATLEKISAYDNKNGETHGTKNSEKSESLEEAVTVAVDIDSNNTDRSDSIHHSEAGETYLDAETNNQSTRFSKSDVDADIDSDANDKKEKISDEDDDETGDEDEAEKDHEGSTTGKTQKGDDNAGGGEVIKDSKGDRSKGKDLDGKNSYIETDSSLSCETANSCKACSEKAVEVLGSLNGKLSCFWESEKCVEISKKEGEAAVFPCTDAPPAAGTTSKLGKADDNDKRGSSFFFGVAAIIGFFVVAFVARRKVLQKFGRDPISLPGPGANDDFSFAMTAATGSTGISGEPRYNQETVPLSSATEDEWGWEDGGGDIEMSSDANNRIIEESGAQMAVAPLKPESAKQMKPFLAKQPKRTTAKSSIHVNRTNSGSGMSGSSAGSGSGSARRSVAPARAHATPPPIEPAPTAPTKPDDFASLLAESRPSHVPVSQYITSFAKKVPAPVTKKAEKKQQEDDIFASMGLVTKPKFNKNPALTTSRFDPGTGTSASSSGWRNTVGTAVGTTSNRLSTPDEGDSDFVDAETGSDWNDDSDLDDLLDD